VLRPYLVASLVSVVLALWFVVVAALAGGEGLLLRVAAAVLVLDQATVTLLAARVPAMAPFRPLVRVSAPLTVIGGLATLAWGVMHVPGLERWILLAGGVALTAQGAFTFFVARGAASSQTTA
jgi:hypothetical protein